MATASTVGVDDFIHGLAQCGVTATVNGVVVTFTVEACSGPIQGQPVRTGVGIDELASWPLCPPHWIHLPNTVTFAHTNPSADSTLPGWLRHSRQVERWHIATDPTQRWIAHVLAVLAQATSA